MHSIIRAFRRSYSYAILLGLVLLTAGFLPLDAKAQTATFAADKYLCQGAPNPNSPGNCTPIATIGSGTPVYYVIKITPLPYTAGQPITITETYPSGFVAA